MTPRINRAIRRGKYAFFEERNFERGGILTAIYLVKKPKKNGNNLPQHRWHTVATYTQK